MHLSLRLCGSVRIRSMLIYLQARANLHVTQLHAGMNEGFGDFRLG